MLIEKLAAGRPRYGIKRAREFKIGPGDNLIAYTSLSAVRRQKGRCNQIIVSKTALALDDAIQAFFIRNEAEALLRLSHPHIIACFGHGEIQGWPYLALEHIETRSLIDDHDEVTQFLPLDNVLQIIEQTALALAYVHDQGWVHADVKPGNILWDGKTAKLSDFAIARPEGQRLPIESDQRSFGTLHYMSLSRMMAIPPTKLDDIHALGITLFELLTGKTDRVQIAFWLEGSAHPAPVKELVACMGVMGSSQPFPNCHEVVEYIRHIRSRPPGNPWVRI